MINMERIGSRARLLKKLGKKGENPFGSGFEGATYSSTTDFSDFFKEIFGKEAGFGRNNFGSASGKFRGQDLQTEISLTLREAATTHPRTFSVGGKASE